MGELRCLSKSGDSKIIWDADNRDEIAAAEEQFNTLKKKGFRAFKVKSDGKKGVEIKKFDSKAGKIIMIPKLVGG